MGFSGSVDFSFTNTSRSCIADLMVFTNSERGGKLDDKNVFGDVDETLICELLQNNDQNGNDDDDDNSIKYETQTSRRNFLF